MINELDKDATGVVRFPDFLLLMANKVDQELVPIDIQEAFTVFDNDGNGHITRSELRHVMMNLGENVTEEECDFLCEVTK